MIPAGFFAKMLDVMRDIWKGQPTPAPPPEVPPPRAEPEVFLLPEDAEP